MRRQSEAQRGGRWATLLAEFKSQIWLVPVFISVLLGLLAVFVIWYGPIMAADTTPPAWMFSGDARTARDLLGTILSGLITMTSLVLSMTFVVLTLAANQLGPRLVVILTGDRQIQAALGLFVGSITYVLIVLRSINDELGQNAVPHLAITISSGLVLLCLLALMIYVHKIARSIVADTVVERVSRDLKHGLDCALVDRQSHVALWPREIVGGSDVWIGLGTSGYIQSVDYDALVNIARDRNGLLQLTVRPGHFVLKHGPHVRIRSPAGIDDSLIEDVRDTFQIGSERSPAQDLEFSVRQLVESATRALSSGTKDPFTVVAVVDKLSQALEMLTGDKDLPSPDMVDDDGVLRVRAAVVEFANLIDTAFGQIRQGAAGDPFVLARIADAMGNLLAATRRQDAKEVLLDNLDKLESTVKASITIPCDREECLSRIENARNQTSTRPADVEEFGTTTQPS